MNDVGRVAQLKEDIEGYLALEEIATKPYRMQREGILPLRVTHNDTKTSNILFDAKTHEHLSVIDLDTVMSAPALNDFGDAIRTYANTGAEDATDLSTVSLSLPMFAAYADGYLSQQANTLTQAELDHLAFSARYITFEQVLRFLMDYINGDTYYKIKSPLHNLERTHAQYALLQSIEAQYEAMCEVIKNTTAKYLA
jgi:Ser/Thr protein kinase RdoA (MazF antagonist)